MIDIEDVDDFEYLQDLYGGSTPLCGPLNEAIDLEPLRTSVCPDCYIERSNAGRCFCDPVREGP